MILSYCACKYDKHPAQFWFDRLKTDQDLPIYLHCTYELFGQSIELVLGTRIK